MKNEPVWGFAFLTGYNGKDKCQTDMIKHTTPFKTGTSIIFDITINMINIKYMIQLTTILLIIAKLSKYEIMKFGISPPYWLSNKHL